MTRSALYRKHVYSFANQSGVTIHVDTTVLRDTICLIGTENQKFHIMPAEFIVLYLADTTYATTCTSVESVDYRGFLSIHEHFK